MKSSNLPVLFISAVIGAVVGVGAGLVLLKRGETRGKTITAGEGLSIGLLVLGLLRQIGQLGDGEDS